MKTKAASETGPVVFERVPVVVYPVSRLAKLYKGFIGTGHVLEFPSVCSLGALSQLLDLPLHVEKQVLSQ